MATSKQNTSTKQLLTDLENMVAQLNSTNSTNEKIDILVQNWAHMKDFLALLYDPLQTTGVTAAQVEKFMATKAKPTKKAKASAKPTAIKRGNKKQKIDDDEDQDNDDVKHAPNHDDEDVKTGDAKNKVEELIVRLYTRQLSGNDAKRAVVDMINTYPEHKELLLNVVGKDLKTRVGVKQLNRAFPNLINEFSVALATDIEKAASFWEKNKQKRWFISRKFDGVRCIVMVENGKARAYSRTGSVLPALKPLEDLLETHFATNGTPNEDFALDGEIISCADESGTENFTTAVSSAKRKSVQMTDYQYRVFDMINLAEFRRGESKLVLSERLAKLKTFVDQVNDQKHLKLVEQVPYTPESLVEMKAACEKQNWEGLMIRLDTLYKGKRSNDILKIKSFFTEEYVVKGMETGTMRAINPDTGLEETIDVMTAVRIEHKDNDVFVGSGFSLAERQDFLQNPKKIVGQTISVRYFEEIIDPDDASKVSLRFPTFKALHGRTRTL